MTQTRDYRMVARAESAERTRDAIVGSVLDLALELPFAAITLKAVAARAGVSVQTIMRRFGSRDGLLDAVVETATRDEVRARAVADVDTALTLLVERYEAVGDRMLALLEQERHDLRVRAITDHGRALHLAWLRQVFAAPLAGLPAPERTAATDLLLVATDLCTWQLLRRDRRLSPAVVRRRMRALVDAALLTASAGAPR